MPNGLGSGDEERDRLSGDFPLENLRGFSRKEKKSVSVRVCGEWVE